MSGKRNKAASPSGPSLRPTILHDSIGDYIVITCGSLGGNLYLSKFDESKKSQSKCIVARGKWYSPSEFESLAGRKARKWRQSLHHQGKPLAMFSISGSLSSQGSSQGDHSVMLASSQDVTGSRSTPVSGLVLQSDVSDNHSSDRAVSVGTSCDLFIVDTVLSFIKAYHLKGDNNSLKIKVCERFSGASVSAA